jgi:hypothetical protein
VALRDTGPIWEWATEVRPAFLVGLETLAWLTQAGEQPWQAPRVPVEGLLFDDRR